MNYTTFIFKLLAKPKHTIYDKKITIAQTEVLGKFYQFRNNSQTVCNVSIWGKAAYEILKYYKKNDYVVAEGYISLKKTELENFNTTTLVELSVFKIYPLSIKIEHKNQ
jgi:single-stranded DNA-binding protein